MRGYNLLYFFSDEIFLKGFC